MINPENKFEMDSAAVSGSMKRSIVGQAGGDGY